MNRLERVIENMKAHDIRQMIISNPADVYYLTGNEIMFGDRYMGVILKDDFPSYFVTNPLHRNQNIPQGMERIDIKDGEPAENAVAGCLDTAYPVAVDAITPAGLVLPLKKALGDISMYVDVSCLSQVKEQKDEDEIEKMKISSKINDQVMEHVSNLLHEGITEKEIFDQMEGIYRQYGADHMSFAGVCFGKNAAEPHHINPDNSRLKKGDCVLFDIGGIKDGYNSDMTRTFFFGGVSEEQRKVYELVKKANEAAEAIIRPGIRYSDIDKAARDVIEEAGYGEYFFHGTGHGIGLGIHEGPRVAKGNDELVKEGVIFSVEPGIYLEGKFGVRIEDLVVVTKDGYELLNHLSKDLIIL